MSSAMIVPSLRFPEFDGQWKSERLGEVSQIRTGPFGSLLHQEDYVDVGTPIITVEHLGEQGVIHKNLPLVSEDDKVRLKSFLLKNGDIVFSRVGSVDRNSIISDKENGWLFSGRLLRIRTNQNIASNFLSYYFKQEYTKHRIRSMAVGQTMPSLNTDILRQFYISAPQVYFEQQKIADFLTAVDKRIEQLEEKKLLLSEYKKGVMQQIFSQQIRFKDDHGNPYPDWEGCDLIEISENGLSNGVFNDPLKVGRGYKLINVKDMYVGDIIDIDTLSLLDLNERVFVRNKVEYGDIFFTRSSLVKSGIAYTNVNLSDNDRLTYDGHLIRMRPKKNIVNPKFLAYLFKTDFIRKQLIKRGKTATMTTIGQDDVAEISVFFPELKEQQKIANFLTSIDNKIEQVGAELEQAKTFKKGLLQQMFV